MKKLFISLIAFLGLTVAFAQVTVPNAGFEEWTDNTHPAGWTAAFNQTFSVNVYGMPIEVPVDYNAANQSTDAHSGSYAIEVVPQEINKDNQEDVTFKFRVRKPVKDVWLIIESNGQQVAKIMKPVLIPSEMVMVKLSKDKLDLIKDEVTLRLEAR